MSADKAAARRLSEDAFGRGNLDADKIMSPGCLSYGPGVGVLN